MKLRERFAGLSECGGRVKSIRVIPLGAHY
jgi:hypothetical protein